MTAPATDPRRRNLAPTSSSRSQRRGLADWSVGLEAVLHEQLAARTHPLAHAQGLVAAHAGAGVSAGVGVAIATSAAHSPWMLIGGLAAAAGAGLLSAGIGYRLTYRAVQTRARHDAATS